MNQFIITKRKDKIKKEKFLRIPEITELIKSGFSPRYAAAKCDVYWDEYKDEMMIKDSVLKHVVELYNINLRNKTSRKI